MEERAYDMRRPMTICIDDWEYAGILSRHCWTNSYMIRNVELCYEENKCRLLLYPTINNLRLSGSICKYSKYFRSSLFSYNRNRFFQFTGFHKTTVNAFPRLYSQISCIFINELQFIELIMFFLNFLLMPIHTHIFSVFC